MSPRSDVVEHQAPTAPEAAPRPRLAAVALPSEHGGWGLTIEPGLLGLLVAPSWAGACIAAAAVVAFLARTPLKLTSVDRRRGRRLPRTVLAQQVAALELVLLAILVAGALARASSPFWVPAAIASPLVALEAWFDIRSRGRRLAPELAGAIAVASVAAMIVLADGRSTSLAFGVWLILAARVVTSVPSVRALIARLHGRLGEADLPWETDVVAAGLATAAVVVDHRMVAGAGAVVALIGLQRLVALRPVRRAAVLGIVQSAFGLALVLATAAGIAWG